MTAPRTIRITAGAVSMEASLRTKDEIRPYSPVNVVGRLSGDATQFTRVRSGTTVRIEPVS